MSTLSDLNEEELQYDRDLRWVIGSPDLLESLSGCNSPAGSEEAEYAIDRAKLGEFLRVRSDHRVGHYFEDLVHFWLTHIRRVEMVAHREQIIIDGRTIGELDFVFRDENGRLQHWETAVKFYLQALPNTGDDPRYLGPNTSDTLERKIERLRTHQLPLGTEVYSEIESQRVHVKGRIYYHPSSIDHRAPGLAADHARGTWIHVRELDCCLAANADWCAAAILKKPFWLTPGSERLRLDELKTAVELHFSKGDNAMHLSFFDSEDGETDRVFVVGNRWPEL